MALNILAEGQQKKALETLSKAELRDTVGQNLLEIHKLIDTKIGHVEEDKSVTKLYEEKDAGSLSEARKAISDVNKLWINTYMLAKAVIDDEAIKSAIDGMNEHIGLIGNVLKIDATADVSNLKVPEVEPAKDSFDMSKVRDIVIYNHSKLAEILKVSGTFTESEGNEMFETLFSHVLESRRDMENATSSIPLSPSPSAAFKETSEENIVQEKEEESTETRQAPVEEEKEELNLLSTPEAKKTGPVINEKNAQASPKESESSKLKKLASEQEFDELAKAKGSAWLEKLRAEANYKRQYAYLKGLFDKNTAEMKAKGETFDVTKLSFWLGSTWADVRKKNDNAMVLQTQGESITEPKDISDNFWAIIMATRDAFDDINGIIINQESAPTLETDKKSSKTGSSDLMKAKIMITAPSLESYLSRLTKAGSYEKLLNELRAKPEYKAQRKAIEQSFENVTDASRVVNEKRLYDIVNQYELNVALSNIAKESLDKSIKGISLQQVPSSMWAKILATKETFEALESKLSIKEEALNGKGIVKTLTDDDLKAMSPDLISSRQAAKQLPEVIRDNLKKLYQEKPGLDKTVAAKEAEGIANYVEGMLGFATGESVLPSNTPIAVNTSLSTATSILGNINVAIKNLRSQDETIIPSQILGFGDLNIITSALALSILQTAAETKTRISKTERVDEFIGKYADIVEQYSQSERNSDQEGRELAYRALESLSGICEQQAK